MTGNTYYGQMIALHFVPSIRPKATEAYNRECLVPTVKHGGGSVIIWAAVSWYSAGPIVTLNG
jgi:hypothetical protein